MTTLPELLDALERACYDLEVASFASGIDAVKNAEAARLAARRAIEEHVAAFRSSTPSQCNCVECRDLRAEFEFICPLHGPVAHGHDCGTPYPTTEGQ